MEDGEGGSGGSDEDGNEDGTEDGSDGDGSGGNNKRDCGDSVDGMEA